MKWLYKLHFAILEITGLIKYKSVRGYHRLEVKCGFKAIDGTPLVCYKCGCKNFHYGKTYQEEGVGLVEYEYKCNVCDSLVGYWAYGNWTV